MVYFRQYLFELVSNLYINNFLIFIIFLPHICDILVLFQSHYLLYHLLFQLHIFCVKVLHCAGVFYNGSGGLDAAGQLEVMVAMSDGGVGDNFLEPSFASSHIRINLVTIIRRLLYLVVKRRL